MEFAKTQLGKDWELLCKLNRAKFYNILLKAKDELCTRQYDSSALNLESFSDLDDVSLTQDDFSASFKDKLPLEATLRKLISTATKGKPFSRLFFCGSASRHVLVRDALETIAKDMGFRTSEVMNADEAVVSGLVFSHLPLNNPSPYAYTEFVRAATAKNVDSDTKIIVEDPADVDVVEINSEYEKQFQMIQYGDEQMEKASREYRDRIERIRESIKG